MAETAQTVTFSYKQVPVEHGEGPRKANRYVIEFHPPLPGMNGGGIQSNNWQLLLVESLKLLDTVQQFQGLEFIVEESFLDPSGERNGNITHPQQTLVEAFCKNYALTRGTKATFRYE